MSHSVLTADWSFPTDIRFGAGRVRELAAVCNELDLRRPLFVSDAGLMALPLAANRVEELRGAGIGCIPFSDFHPNPVYGDIIKGVKHYRSNACDGVIAFGGGSSLDVGKAIAFAVVQDDDPQQLLVASFEQVPDMLRRARGGLPTIISVPTTAGTASEIGRSAAIIDEREHVKKAFFHSEMMPRVCIADPETTLGLSPSLTAALGMDALSHNLEAYCNGDFHPCSDGAGLEGVRLLKNWLPAAVADGSDLTARTMVMAASLAGGVAFQKGVGAVHALSHPLSSCFGVHHGLANAVIMPYVVLFNLPVIQDKLAAMARYLDLPDPSGNAILEWLIALREQLAIPHTLAELGIAEADLEGLSRLAVADLAAGQNPRHLDLDDAREIYLRAFGGVLP